MDGRGRVVFVDTVATAPYDDRTLRTQAMGGTEATVVRVATALARGRPVAVLQAARKSSHRGEGVDFLPYDFKRGEPSGDAEAIVVVRAHKVLRRIRRRNPDARLFLWMHCFPGRRLDRFGGVACGEGCTVLAVSDHHRRRMLEHVARHEPRAARALDIRTVYNPVDPSLAPDETPVDPSLLVFLSSPHKGLDQVLEAFRAVRARVPEMRLHVANPGYLERELHGDLGGVVPLGKLPHRDALAQVRRALCLFYPQNRFEETFGLVLAEANAVGTPVLAHPIGSAPEVVEGPREQLVDAADHAAIVGRILRWRDGARPRVGPHPGFRLTAVRARWEALLGEGREGELMMTG